MTKTNKTIHFIAVLGFSIFILITLGPLQPSRQVWGGDVHDVYQHLNVRAWQADQAKTARFFPTYTKHMCFPEGGAIFPANAVGGTLTVPLVWAVGLPAAYNLQIFFSLLFACWAMFWLVHRIAKDPWSAFLAGISFGLSPFLIAQVQNGITESLQAGWLALFLGSLIALYQDGENPTTYRKTILYAAVVALVWWVASVSFWYYGLYAGVLFGLITIYFSFSARRRAVWIRSAVTVVVFLILIFPAVHLFIEVANDPSLLSKGLSTKVIELVNCADPAYLWKARPPDAESHLHLGFIGYLIPLLVLFALWWSTRKKQVAWWSLAALLFCLLSIGPILFFHHQPVTMLGATISLPYGWLVRAAPLLDSMSYPYRFFIMVHLCLAVAVGLGLAGYANSKRYKPYIFIGLSILLWAETVFLSGVPFLMPKQDIEPRGPLHALNYDQQPGAVLDLPLEYSWPAIQRYAVNQIFHRRPIPYNVIQTVDKRFSRALVEGNLTLHLLYEAGNPDAFEKPFLPYLRPLAKELLNCIAEDGPCDAFLRQVAQNDVIRLNKLGIRFILLHKDLTPNDSPLPRICRRLLGQPIESNERMELFLTKISPGKKL